MTILSFDDGYRLGLGRSGGVPAADSYPLVSVVMATYNCGKFLQQAVDSVLAQTYPNIEVIVVNDGSTDDTTAVLQGYHGDARVRSFEQSNQGQTKAKNKGIREARGEFIAFCDADDLWRQDKLMLQMPAFRQSRQIGVVYSRASRIDETGRPLNSDDADEQHPSGKVTIPLFKTNFIPFGTAVVRRACLDEMGGFNEAFRMGIDWELWLRISTRYEFAFLDEATYVSRLWTGQMSNNWKGRYEAAFRIMSNFLAEHPAAVPSADVQEAMADSYIQRARLRALTSKEYLPALGDTARAIRHAPTSWVAWRSIAFVLATAAGRSA